MLRQYLRPAGILLFIAVAGISVTGGLFWANLRYTRENPGGNDFLVHWLGTRHFLMEGSSPYSDAVAREIQIMAYGRPARPGEHELRVAYPLYSQIIFAPFAMVGNFPLSRALWMTLLEVSILALAVASLRLTGWQSGLWLLPFYLLFSLFWYHSVRPLINGNAVILVALLAAIALLAIRNNRDETAGILLALTMIKPHVIILPVAFILLWSITERRWLVPLWFFGSLVLMTLLGMLFLPDWPLQNLREVLRYPAYNPPGTPGAALAEFFPGLGGRLGLALSVSMGVVLVFEWIRALGKEFRHFLWAVCLTLVVSQWIGIQTDPGNFIVAFPALVLTLAVWSQRWGTAGRLASLLAMLVLFGGLWWLFLATILPGPQPQQSPIMFFPLPLFLFICLYWVRWWAIRPPPVWLDTLREGG